jgi:endoglucanase Acf2
MSFKAFQPTDIVVSSDSITSTLWSTGAPTLTTFFTSSTQVASTAGNYYYNIYQNGSTVSGSAVQFALAYGNKDGSGSLNYNNFICIDF